MNTLQISRLSDIENEIKALKQQTALGMLAIGDKLIEAKKLVPHGQWESWLTNNVNFSPRTARNLMRTAMAFTGDRQALSDLDATKLYYLAELPEEERNNFIDSNDVATMSSRELKKAINERHASLFEPIFTDDMKKAFSEALKTDDLALIQRWHDLLSELSKGVSEIVIDLEVKVGELLREK